MDDGEIPRGIATLSGPVRVHFDGACETLRGRRIATYGYHLEGGGFLHEDAGLAVAPDSDWATNNVAEYSAAIRALDWLDRQGYVGEVVLYGDSELVVRQMNGEYEVRAEHLKAYHDHLAQLAGRFAHSEFHWIPREENTRADALSKQALTEGLASPDRTRPAALTGPEPVDPEEDEPPSEER